MVCRVLATCGTKVPWAHAVRGPPGSPFSLVSKALLLLRTLFSGWLHCKNDKSIIKINFLTVLVHSYSIMACGCGLLLHCPMARKTLLVGFVTGSLFIHNTQPLPWTLKWEETLNKRLTQQTSATTKAHAHGALLIDIARMLQTAV